MTATLSSIQDSRFAEPTQWPALDEAWVPQSYLSVMPTRPARRVGQIVARAAELDPRARMPRERLQPLARSWMHDLPLKVRPGLTAQRHPHVVNRLAAAWASPSQLRQTFSELLLSSRTGRRGFDLTVLDELLTLQAYSLEARRY